MHRSLTWSAQVMWRQVVSNINVAILFTVQYCQITVLIGHNDSTLGKPNQSDCCMVFMFTL